MMLSQNAQALLEAVVSAGLVGREHGYIVAVEL